MGYVLDTNLLIDTLHDRAKADELDRFYLVHLPATFLHAVVAQEILAGAGSRKYVDLLQARFVTPFERRRRLVAPTCAAWKQAGKVISRLIELRHRASIERS